MSKKDRFKPADMSGIRTEPLASRHGLVKIEQSAKVTMPGAGASEFIDSIPDILAGKNLRELVNAIVEANNTGRLVIMAMGAHVLKCGLSPLIIDLMERGIVSAIVTNGACAVHDYELAACGSTSEDVKLRLEDGSFGNAGETAEALNIAAAKGIESGFGRALGELILNGGYPHEQNSIYAAAARLDIPATIHVAIGTDVVHIHPSTDGKALGEATYADFRILVSIISNLQKGVYINFGSAVILPEVFLKALSAARNLGAEVSDFTTADFDMIKHYRPMQNVVCRPGGRGLSFVGHHEIMLPLLRQAVIERLGQ